MRLRRAIVSNALCCPSRATILTGRYSHTTGVYANGGDDGGWHAFQPSEPNTIATAPGRRRLPHSADRQVPEQLRR